MDKKSLFFGLQIGSLVAGQRRKTAETWETIFDGELTATQGAIFASCDFLINGKDEHFFQAGDTVAVTVDGNKTVFSGEVVDSDTIGVGDTTLYTANTSGAYGYCILSQYLFGFFKMKMMTLEPGTYTVKIEWRVS